MFISDQYRPRPVKPLYKTNAQNHALCLCTVQIRPKWKGVTDTQ